MKLLVKLKNIKRKWICIGLVIVIIITGIGILGAILHERLEHRDGEKGINNYQVYYDLLYLENTNNMLLSSSQAKAILPFAEKLSSADETTQKDIIKSIYDQLTPQQYYLLLNGDNKNGTEPGNFRRGKGKEEFRGDRKRDEWNHSNLRNSDSLKDIVLKMLKDQSNK